MRASVITNYTTVDLPPDPLVKTRLPAAGPPCLFASQAERVERENPLATTEVAETKRLRCTSICEGHVVFTHTAAAKKSASFAAPLPMRKSLSVSANARFPTHDLIVLQPIQYE